MAQETINVGTVANDGTGDPLRVSFIKTNNNFSELYHHWSNNYSNIADLQNTVSTFDTNVYGVADDAFNRANLAYSSSNSVNTYAQSIDTKAIAAFSRANTGSTIAVYAANHANAAFDRANLSNDVLYVAASFDTANAAFGKVNTTSTTANAGFTFANGVATNTTAAFTKANSAYDLANGAYIYANTLVSESTNLTPVFTVANAAFDAANNASNNANTSELTSNGFVVSLNTAGYVTFGQTGYSVPDVVDRSGEKLVLWDQSGFYSYSIGIEPDAMWLGVDEGLSTKGFTWYTGNTRILELTRSGNVNFSANGHIYNRANSSGDGLGLDTIEIYPDNRYSNGLIIDPTAPNHIHLRGTGDQDNALGPLFVGGENSYFQIPGGLNPTPIITSNGSSWTFQDGGSLQFPDATVQYTAYSNTVFDVANGAFDYANSINTIPAFNKANSAYDLANSAYIYANTIIGESTNLTPVFTVANAAFGFANGVATNAAAAFAHANSALQNTTGTFAGSLTVTGNTVVDGIAPGYAPNRPAFRVHGSGTTNDLSITVNGTGCLTSNNWTVDFNQGTYLSNTNGVFIAPVTGLYQVNIVARNSDYPSGISQLGVTKNGTSGGTVGGDCIIMVEFAANSSMNHAGSSTIIKLNVGDTLACKVLAGEINFDSNDNWSVAYIG